LLVAVAEQVVKHLVVHIFQVAVVVAVINTILHIPSKLAPMQLLSV
jgi:hypothetical protein